MSESCESDKCLAESFFSYPTDVRDTYDKRCFLDSFTTRLGIHKEKVRFNLVKYSRTNAWCYAKYWSAVEVFFFIKTVYKWLPHIETHHDYTNVCTCLLTYWYALIVTYFIRGKWEVPIKHQKLTNLLTVPRKTERKLKRWRSALFLCGHMMTGNFVTQYINWTCFMQFLCLGCFALLFGSFSAWFGLY